MKNKKTKELDNGDKSPILLRATHGAPKKEHIIGEIEIDCYVLEGGLAVLSGRGMQRALGIGEAHGSKLTTLLSNKDIIPFINNDLATAINRPLKFIRPGKGDIPRKKVKP